jgi:hypothetical protein
MRYLRLSWTRLGAAGKIGAGDAAISLCLGFDLRMSARFTSGRYAFEISALPDTAPAMPAPARLLLVID